MIEHPPGTTLPPAQTPPLQRHERLYYRDQLRAARYSALADAEGFGEICFALEALGMRLLGKKEDLGQYGKNLSILASDSVVLTDLSKDLPQYFTHFSALYAAVRNARNDAMHTGVYARHVTSSAVELCIGLEEALMKEKKVAQMQVKDLVVKSPVSIEPWQPVAYARQLMLTHSFSFLPVYRRGWELLSELSMAKYLNNAVERKKVLAVSIEYAANNGLMLIPADVVGMDDKIEDLLAKTKYPAASTLWLIEDRPGVLAGVLSPFELM